MLHLLKDIMITAAPPALLMGVPHLSCGESVRKVRFGHIHLSCGESVRKVRFGHILFTGELSNWWSTRLLTFVFHPHM